MKNIYIVLALLTTATLTPLSVAWPGKYCNVVDVGCQTGDGEYCEIYTGPTACEVTGSTIYGFADGAERGEGLWAACVNTAYPIMHNVWCTFYLAGGPP